MNSATSKILGFILMICMLTSLFSIIYHMNDQKYKTETAILAEADDSVSFKAVYIRNEEVVSYGGNGVVSYCVSDGGKLGKGSVIAEIYADESQIDIKQKIDALNNQLEIINKIQNPGTVESAQPANLAPLIEEKYKNIINERETGNFDNISAERDELAVLLSTYQLVTDSGIDLTSRVSELNSQIAKLQASETVPLDSIVSDKSAYFVSYADGYEDKFTMDKLSSLTPELINSVKDSGPVEDGNIIGKLIDGYEWYAAGVIDNRNAQFSIDEDVTLKFQSTSDTVEGTVYDIRDTKVPGESIVIIKCDELTYDLVQHRTERIEMIKGEYEGIKVSRKAIRFKDVEETVVDEETGKETRQLVNCKGVYVKLGEQINFKKLDVIYEGSNYVLSSLNAGNDYVSLYDDIVVEGVDADGN
ncbi:HlyD family efflux transporter periplasmic adaptor subunit [Porcipelethomonas sp.]|uniref:HlyD family efflux transporter periplasmic adaptor subunit n=1 Tax=Porcipelethomonas sp. TaxID=2981675 RepID=UPI003EFAB598